MPTRHSKRDARYSSDSVGGDSGAIRKFSDKYIVLEKLVGKYVEHLAQIRMRNEKKKDLEESERERKERLNREYDDIDWVGLQNSDNGERAILVFFPSQIHFPLVF